VWVDEIKEDPTIQNISFHFHISIKHKHRITSNT